MAKILAVDDELFNLDILVDYLVDDGHEVISASDGLMALRQLAAHPDIDVILLDRMMPHLDGMGVLAKLKDDERYADIPVIMQTAAAGSDQVLQGIQAGVYYYLTKPYEDAMLLAVVRAAYQDAINRREMKARLNQSQSVPGLTEQARFRFRTLEDVKNLVYFVANCFPSPEQVVYGLNEILVNAVEHGNLGITYHEKTQLVLNGMWHDEIERRLALPDNVAKYGYLSFETSDDYIEICVQDQGAGFDWQKYMEISVDRATDPHGRGIALSRLMSFNTLQYLGCGNEVICRVFLDGRGAGA